MRLARADFVPLLAIVAGGVIGASLAFSFLGSRSNDVPTQEPEVRVDLSPSSWLADYDEFMQGQLITRTTAGVASGKNGAVTVAANGYVATTGQE